MYLFQNLKFLPNSMHVASIEDAWKLIYFLHSGIDMQYSKFLSDRAGYDVYEVKIAPYADVRETISNLGTRFELNFSSGATKIIWYE